MFQVILAIISFFVACIALFRSLADHFSIKKQNKDLLNLVSELKRTIKHRGHLASEIAHEIKNPITAILCSAETLDLVLADKLDDVQRTSLRYIIEYGANLH